MVHPRLKVKYQGKLLTVAEAAKMTGISITAFWFRLEKGWPREKLFSREKFSRGGRPSPAVLAMAGEITAEEYLRMENANPQPS